MNHNRLSSAGPAWLHMDRPTNLMVINSVELFDEPPDWERVKQVIQRPWVIWRRAGHDARPRSRGDAFGSVL